MRLCLNLLFLAFVLSLPKPTFSILQQQLIFFLQLYHQLFAGFAAIADVAFECEGFRRLLLMSVYTYLFIYWCICVCV